MTQMTQMIGTDEVCILEVRTFDKTQKRTRPQLVESAKVGKAGGANMVLYNDPCFCSSVGPKGTKVLLTNLHTATLMSGS
jgi:hypothetical protein